MSECIIDVKRYKSKDGKPLLSSNVVDIATYNRIKQGKYYTIFDMYAKETIYAFDGEYADGSHVQRNSCSLKIENGIRMLDGKKPITVILKDGLIGYNGVGC